MRKLLIGPLVLCLGLQLTLVSCDKKKTFVDRGSAEADLEQCMKLSRKKHYEEAIECLEIYKSRYPGTTASAEAELSIGDNFFDQKDYLLAAESYESFIRNHPLHDRVDYAFYRLGLSYLTEAPKAIDRDQEYLDDSIRAFQTQLRLYPESSYRPAVEEGMRDATTRIGRRHYYVGNFYYRTGEYRAAIPRLYQVIMQYPEIPEYEKAFYKLALSFLKLNELDRAQQTYTEMSSRIPESRWTKKTGRAVKKKTGSAPAAPAAPVETSVEGQEESS